MGLAHLADRLAPILQRYPPDSKECVAVHGVWRLFAVRSIAAKVVRVTHALLGQYFHTQDEVCFAETGFHVTVQVNDLLIDLSRDLKASHSKSITPCARYRATRVDFYSDEMRDAPSD